MGITYSMRKITSKPTFKIEEWSENTLAIISSEAYEPPIKGLPPSKTSFILLNSEDIDNLLKVLNDYANKRRNT